MLGNSLRPVTIVFFRPISYFGYARLILSLQSYEKNVISIGIPPFFTKNSHILTIKVIHCYFADSNQCP